MDWNEYHTQDDFESYLDYLADTYDFVEIESIGQSYEGRPMRVMKVEYLFYFIRGHLRINTISTGLQRRLW